MSQAEHSCPDPSMICVEGARQADVTPAVVWPILAALRLSEPTPLLSVDVSSHLDGCWTLGAVSARLKLPKAIESSGDLACGPQWLRDACQVRRRHTSSPGRGGPPIELILASTGL